MSGWGKKHEHFIEWKYAEAKVHHLRLFHSRSQHYFTTVSISITWTRLFIIALFNMLLLLVWRAL